MPQSGRLLLFMLADRQSMSADLLDSLAHGEARLGDLNAALLHIQEAIKLEPKKHIFWSNKGAPVSAHHNCDLNP